MKPLGAFIVVLGSLFVLFLIGSALGLESVWTEILSALCAILAARFFISTHKQYMKQPERSREQEIGTRGRPIG